MDGQVKKHGPKQRPLAFVFITTTAKHHVDVIIKKQFSGNLL